ncbi:hypothetical protein ACHWQZ_G019675 [Mnemiopsis leidyi]
MVEQCDIDILDLCKQVCLATGEFTRNFSDDMEHSRSLFDSSNKLEESLDGVLEELSGGKGTSTSAA